MKIRLYQPSDFAQLIALYKNKQAYGGNFDESRDTNDRLEKAARIGNLYVAEDLLGNVVGSFMILDNPHTFWLIRFVVDPAAGDYTSVGEVLTEKALKIAIQRGHHSLIVYTDTNDQKLNKRYSDLNFHKAGAYRCYWKEVTNEV